VAGKIVPSNDRSNSVMRSAHSNNAPHTERAQKEYETNMLDRGVCQEESSKQEVVKKYVNKTLFCELKFIRRESQIEFKGKLACKIMLDFAVQPENQLQFWDKQKAFINTTIAVKFIGLAPNQKRLGGVTTTILEED
jgi:hypothetical protein